MLGKVQKVFDDCWEILAAHGKVDAAFGAEYQRVRRLWLWTDDYGPNLMAWIMRQANRPPRPGGSESKNV